MNTSSSPSSINGFYELLPEQVLGALEGQGLAPTGQVLQLNSYENRVFEIELEEPFEGSKRVVAKFYRPQRWSPRALQEEHDFLRELQDAGMKTFPPLKLSQSSTYAETPSGILWSVFPKIQGRLPQELLPDDFRKVGRQLAILHNVGASKRASSRPSLTAEELGDPALRALEKYLSPELHSRYFDAAETILDELDDSLDPSKFLRIHGDCHRGNLLTDEKDFFFVDFDDFCNGPAVQDFWMLTADDLEYETVKQQQLLSGYRELRDFEESSLELIPLLRGLRMIHYSGWIARRWADPSFPRLFPDFLEFSYWAEETEALEQIAWRAL